MARQRRRGSRCSAPPELRMAYGSRARPLGRAIISLLPPPPPPATPCPTCHSSAGCLACRRWAHLLREGDPVAYRRLVTRGVCAVAPAGAAPPPPRYTPGNAGYSQAKLVGETIKSIMADRSCTTRNVLCIGCREGGLSRCVSDLVSSSSWDILLHRIGDLLMCYILRHSSIFLSVKKNDYFQVSGLPLNIVLLKPIFVSAMGREQQSSKKEKFSTCYMWSKKEMASKLYGGNCVNDSHVAFHYLDGNTSKFDALQSSGNYGAARITGPNCSQEGCNFARFHSTSKSTTCSSLCAQIPSKRKRLYRWQRCNKQKKICCQGESSIIWSKINNNDFNAGAKVTDEVHSLDPTGATNSLPASSDVNYLKTNEQYGVDVLSSEMVPSFMFDRASQCSYDYNTSRCQPAGPIHGHVSFLHLNTTAICCNCFILNSSKYLSADSSIPRHDIFYNRRTSYNIFHGNHILNKRKISDGVFLLKHIFGIKGHSAKYLKCVSHESTTSSNCLCLLKLMTKLARNSRRCQYKTLFLKHCPLKSKVATNGVNNSMNLQYSIGGNSSSFDQSFAQLDAYSTHQQVVSFIWAVLTRVIPEPLLGNSDSKRSLRLNIWKFIVLRRFETFHLRDAIHKLKISDYSWISNIMSSCFCSSQIMREIALSSGSDEQKFLNLLQCWVNWLFSDIVIPLIQAYFYITERESKRYDVFYYPKPVWRDLTSIAIASLNGQNFKILRGSSLRATKQSCSWSRVRFVPKAKDMRPLVNLKAQSKNGLLNKCHLIIKKLRVANPEIFGSSVFNYNDVHKNLSQFISLVRSHLKVENKMYIVVADVSKAFDCISHDMLLKVMDSVLKSDDYVMRKCTKVVCNRSKNAIYRFDSNCCISKGDNICDFSFQLSSGGGVLVDQGKNSTIWNKEVQHLLSEQVKRNVLKIGKKFYLQKVGIAQGCKLSPNLCSLYYGHLENSVLLKFLHDGKISSGEDGSVPNSLLMRFIDDFIFISFSRKHALDFFNRMRRGFVYYNCYMNNRKYGFNFEVANSEYCCNRLYMGDDGFSFIPWSGLLVNCENMEIQADYTRYLDIVISSTITVKKYSSTKYLQKKLCHYMRPKCHPIFFDSMINSPRTVRLNLYQAFLLCAMKFHCYVKSIPDADINKPEVLFTIKRTFRYMHSLIIRRTQDVELQYSVRPVLKLRRKETMWLGLSAYLRVLQKKQSRYKDLLALLKTEIGKYGHLDRTSDSLCYAVNDSHSSMFWKFKF